MEENPRKKHGGTKEYDIVMITIFLIIITAKMVGYCVSIGSTLKTVGCLYQDGQLAFN